MPCRSEYLAPTAEEGKSRNVCCLLQYVLRELGESVPDRVDAASKSIYGDVAKLDSDTAELCRILKSLTPQQTEKLVYDGRSKRARRLADWWERHQRADERRAAQEKLDAEKDKLRKSALKKLTKQEREALGL